MRHAPATAESAVDSGGFQRASWGWFALLDGGIVVLSVLTASAGAYRRAAATVPLPPRRALRWLLIATGVIHVTEAAVAARRAGSRGLPGRKWGLQTFVVGFPSLLELRRLRRADVPTTQAAA